MNRQPRPARSCHRRLGQPVSDEAEADAALKRAAQLRKTLDETVHALFQMNHRLDVADGNDQDIDFHMTEYMVVVGFQCFNDAGTRGGDVKLLCSDKSVPMYIARGLISSAAEKIERDAWVTGTIQTDDEGSDD